MSVYINGQEVTPTESHLDTQVDAIKTKTDNLPSDPADASDITTAIAVPTADVATNTNMRDVIGNKSDTVAGTSIVALAKQVLSAINSAFALTGNAVVGNVLATKTFYKDNYQTKLTGTMPNNAGAVACVSASITAGTTLSVVPAEGYTDGTDDTSTIDLTTVDADLVTGNIKSGVTILGVAGKTEVVDTTEVANAAAESNILFGKVAFVNGAKMTGNDNNLVNTYEVANAAAEGDIASGKVAWVNGVRITGTHV